MTRSGNWREYVAAFSATLIAAAAGTTVGWTSPTLPLLERQDSAIAITRGQGSWIASIMILSSALTPVPASYLTDRIGRKKTLLLTAVPYILGWILVMFASNVWTLYVSRIISGFGYGIAYTTAPMYLGEIASDNVRGSMATLITVMSKAGILSQYCIGPYVSTTGLASFNVAIPILFALTFALMPESPYYYLKHKQRDLAGQALRKLRGKNFIEEELDVMEALVSENMRKNGKWSDLINSPANRKGLIILFGIYFTQQFCGSTAIISYAQQIFDNSSSLTAAHASIIFGTVQLITSSISSQLVDRVGRKPLLLVSSCGVGICNIIVGSYFYLQYKQYQYIVSIQYIPIIFITAFIFSYTIGLATVPFAITSEIFATNIKSKATCIVQISAAILTFAVTKLYQVVADDWGKYVAFWGFSVLSIAGVVFILVLLPETKGQSFAMIQQKFSHRTSVKYNAEDGLRSGKLQMRQ